MAGKEKTFENKVKRCIEGRGGWQVKFFANRMTKKGVPDVLACINGYFVGIEVKASDGYPSQLQKHQIMRIQQANGFGLILFPKDFGLFQNFLDALMDKNTYRAKNLMRMINERSVDSDVDKDAR